MRFREVYRPVTCGFVVARGGVEPPTFRFSVGRSYQLSYLAVASPGLVSSGQTERRIAPARHHYSGVAASNTQQDRHLEWVAALLHSSDPDRARTGDLRRDRAAR